MGSLVCASLLSVSVCCMIVVGIDLVDNSRCLPEGSMCESSAECCAGELSTLCSHGRCRCWSGMKWNERMRRCVPSFSFRFGALDLDAEDDDDLYYPRNTDGQNPNPSSTGQNDNNVVKVSYEPDHHHERSSGKMDDVDNKLPPPVLPPFDPGWEPKKDGSSARSDVLPEEEKPVTNVDSDPKSGSDRLAAIVSIAACLFLSWLLAT